MADVVAVEHLRHLAALEERVLEGVRHGGLRSFVDGDGRGDGRIDVRRDSGS